MSHEKKEINLGVPIFCTTFVAEKHIMIPMAFELAVLTNKKRRTVWKRAFRLWQRRPHEVAPIGTTLRVCACCKTRYQGNFCPRCGQAARVGRFSFKNAFLLFLDVWGVGNRGMFRSIRDLMLRPGYMIRDYLRGQQAAYFPPFKMFFLLTTFSLLLTHGFHLFPEEEKAQPPKTETVANKIETGMGKGAQKNDQEAAVSSVRQTAQTINLLREKSPALFGFFTLVLISAPLYLFFRRSPAIPDLRYSEHLVALVYTSNMYTLYTMLSEVMKLVGLSWLFGIVALVMIFVSLHQFSGFSKRRLLFYIILTFIITIILIVAAAIVWAWVHGLFHFEYS